MPLIQFQDLAGGTAAFNSNAFLRIRPSHGDAEPVEAVMIQTDRKRLYATDPIATLIEKIGTALGIVSLTTPNGLGVWLAAERIETVVATTPPHHHPLANSVITLNVMGSPSIDQQVRETVVEVGDAFNP